VNCLVVFTHPAAGSFSASVRDRTVAALRAAGHDVDLLDLYREGFDPHVSESEWSGGRPAVDDPVLSDHIGRLRAAEAIVLAYPTWFGGPPAMLKGWLDRVWVEGVAFRQVDGSNRPRARLTYIRRLVVVTTHGSSKWTNTIQGEPGKRLVRRWLRVLCHPFARSRWIAMYDVDRSDAADREAFLRRVEQRVGRL
jgi:putative NADPH-quinone reductase